VLAAALAVLFGFLSWVWITNAGTSDSAVDGWGNISGVPTMDGQNINDVIASTGGFGSYRPALFLTAMAVLVLGCGLVLAWRASRPVAALATVAGVGILGWGLFRGAVPGDVAGVVDQADVHSAVGPWLTVAAGLVVTVVAAAALGNRRPRGARRPVRSRGIQPR
jgi:hypothetical protein